ncbi:hypothetical protein, partial [Paraburkholderia sp. SIMBA_030]
ARPKDIKPKAPRLGGMVAAGPANQRARAVANSALQLEKVCTPTVEKLVKRVGGEWAEGEKWRASLLKKETSIARKIDLIRRERGLTLD